MSESDYINISIEKIIEDNIASYVSLYLDGNNLGEKSGCVVKDTQHYMTLLDVKEYIIQEVKNKATTEMMVELKNTLEQIMSNSETANDNISKLIATNDELKNNTDIIKNNVNANFTYEKFEALKTKLEKINKPKRGRKKIGEEKDKNMQLELEKISEDCCLDLRIVKEIYTGMMNTKLVEDFNTKSNSCKL